MVKLASSKDGALILGKNTVFDVQKTPVSVME